MKKLFSPLTVGGCTIKNRIVFTGHHTYLAERVPGDALIAYLEARARGGAGLVITEIVAVHPSAAFAPKLLVADAAIVVPHYRRLAGACHAHGAKIFAQLFHPGREILSSPSGMAPVAWAPSASPSERFHIMPRPLPAAMITDIIHGYGVAAAHLAAAGLDGFEIVANHGYLPAQFFNPRVNHRNDDYGGDFERRLRFVKEVAAAVRRHADGKVVGLRISADELSHDGLTADEVLKICAALKKYFDYFSVVLGTSATLGASVHISPPMGMDVAIGKFSSPIKKLGLPVIATGGVTSVAAAEKIINDGAADLVGMTRAMIADADLAVKARDGGDIRECINCNQSCIGRAHKGLGVSCIQHPESGRELKFAAPTVTADARTVVVVGGGVGGMKAAAVAAARGHRVTLLERSDRVGGQSNLAALLPGRANFAGMVGNLEREMRAAGVTVNTGVAVSAAMLQKKRADGDADHIVIATGATPFVPAVDGVGQDNVVGAWSVITGEATVGGAVVVADWKGDWVGVGVAEMLAAAGSRVTWCVNGALAGEALQLYTRNYFLARVKKLGVKIKTHLRLFGVDGGDVFFQDVLTGEAVTLTADTVVLSLGHAADDTLARELGGDNVVGNNVVGADHADGETGTVKKRNFHTGLDPVSRTKNSAKPSEFNGDGGVTIIGDALLPRTAEEAVYEGLLAGRALN